MQAVTVHFDRPGKNDYGILLEAFCRSWEQNARIPLHIYQITAPQESRKYYGFSANHAKLKEWVKRLNGDTILIDADMLCLQDISDGFKKINHIGITERDGKIPYNGGVVFVKDTPEAKEFMSKWLEIDDRMLTDSEFHKPYHEKYAGQNQASLGWMLENGYEDMVAVLPKTYNLCEPWSDRQDAKMIHMKGALRRNVFRNHPRKELEPIVELWKEYAQG